MKEKFIDLHMHSYYSDDGEFSPIEIVRKCKEQGIRIMAIADHNCVRANLEGERAALSMGITYIPAVEVDCTFQNVNLHILGYGIDYKSADFYLIEKNIEEQSIKASYQMLLATQELGFHVTENDMVNLSINNYWKEHWTGEMFAEVLLNKHEYKDQPILRPYRSDGSRGDNPYVNFFWDYYSQGKPCYVKMNYPPLEQIIEIIHKNCGKAVLAHPGINLQKHNELLEPIIKAGLDGIEAFSSYHNITTAKYFFEKSREYSVFVTCGSDFHGKTKPAISPGDTMCIIDESEIQEQLENRGLIL